ncbi:MAG TPA: diphthine--ammonia ligase [Candidatus Baltobacteraceae bacterium]|nr:diphthine--ammonia ligase [Candidatus Baltobacteraceae bacterium]
MKEKVLFCWSGGKDSALALYRLRCEERYDVVALLTTYNEHYRRVSMHGVSLALSELQAQRIGLPLDKVFVSERSSNEEYSARMAERMLFYKEQGVGTVAFGDIFLQDLRQWREENLAQIGMRAIFPLWRSDTRELVREFTGLGFKSRVCCVSEQHLDQRALGRDVDAAFVDSLPAGVDPCGENGEFHSFAYAGPIFSEPLEITTGECVHRDGFWYCDLNATVRAAAAITRRRRTR